MRCEQLYDTIYQRSPDGIAFCPYRICPIGAHVDHQFGRITGLAIDRGIHIAYGPKRNGVIEMTSLQFDKRGQWHIHGVDAKPVGDWADYLRGATWALGKRHELHVGLSGVIEGTMPIGGLSSSAAVIIAFLMALCRVNDIRLSQSQLVQTALEAERDYVGVSVGKLDQSCEVFSKKDHLLYLDTKDDTYELIPSSPAMKPYRIAIFFSGLERSLVGSRFNMRVDEAKAAAYALMAYAGMEYGKYGEAVLRDVPEEIYQRFRDRLPENWAKRAEHFYTEQDRVIRGAQAWKNGDIEEYGRLSYESGRSSICNWETGSEELKALYEIMTTTEGIYGGRFSGAGFKGCCMALIDPAHAEEIEQTMMRRYLKAFPKLEGKCSFYLCESADGIDL